MENAFTSPSVHSDPLLNSSPNHKRDPVVSSPFLNSSLSSSARVLFKSRHQMPHSPDAMPVPSVIKRGESKEDSFSMEHRAESQDTGISTGGSINQGIHY